MCAIYQSDYMNSTSVCFITPSLLFNLLPTILRPDGPDHGPVSIALKRDGVRLRQHPQLGRLELQVEAKRFKIIAALRLDIDHDELR